MIQGSGGGGRTAWRAALVAGALACAGAARSEPAACQMVQVNELPVIMRGDQPTVAVELNGQPASMVIDTGSVATVLFPASLARLGLKAAPVDGSNFAARVEILGVGGGGRPGVVRLRALKIGEQVIRDTNILVQSNYDSGNAPGRSVFGSKDPDGLLGRQFLLQSDLELDFKNNKIRFFKPKNCSGDQVVYWAGAYTVTPMRSADTLRGVDVFVALNGVAISATLDSGASTSVVNTMGAARAGVYAKDMKLTGAIGGIGAKRVPVFRHQFDSFGFGDEIIKPANLSVADLYRDDKETFVGSNIPVSKVDTTQMLLGADFLKSHRVYLARSQRRVYASYLGGPVFEVAADVAEVRPKPTP